MSKKIMKTKLIKKYFGDVIKEDDFEYVGADSVAWKFIRQKGKVSQEIYIVRERFCSNLITLFLFTGMPGWGTQEPQDFIEKYKNREYWRYETEEEFIEILQEFAQIIKEYGLDMLDKMSKPKDAIFVTPEMNQYLYESYETIVAEANQKYDFVKSGREGIAQIVNLIFQKKDENYEDVKMFLVEMAALYVQIIRNDLGGDLSMEKNKCILKNIGKGKRFTIPILYSMSEWKMWHSGEIAEPDLLNSFLLREYKDLK